MRIFILTATYELRVNRKSHLRDHPNYGLTCHSVPSAESVPSECLSSEGNEVCSSQVKVPENNI